MACKWLNLCPLKELEQQSKISIKWKEEYCQTKNNWKNCKRYQLEEQGIEHENILPNRSKISNNKKKKGFKTNINNLII